MRQTPCQHKLGMVYINIEESESLGMIESRPEVPFETLRQCLCGPKASSKRHENADALEATLSDEHCIYIRLYKIINSNSCMIISMNLFRWLHAALKGSFPAMRLLSAASGEELIELDAFSKQHFESGISRFQLQVLRDGDASEMQDEILMAPTTASTDGWQKWRAALGRCRVRML